MIHMDAMLDSFSKTMSRSGLMNFNKSSNVSSTGSSTLSRSSLGSSINAGKSFSARVVFLDDTCQTFEIDKRAKGQYLIDTVFRHLDLGEQEYFGLMFNDAGHDHVPVGHAPDVMRWLDPNKLIRKQVRINLKSGVTPVATLYFRVKFYVTGESYLLLDVEYRTVFEMNTNSTVSNEIDTGITQTDILILRPKSDVFQ